MQMGVNGENEAEWHVGGPRQPAASPSQRPAARPMPAFPARLVS